MIKPTQKAINDASALHNLYETDREAFCNEIKNPDKKPGLHHLLNIHPDFRPRGTADATFTGYEEGTGVWVLEHASNDHYKALEELSEADSSLSWNQKLEKIGATYYAHWNENAVTREHMEDQGRVQQSGGWKFHSVH